MVLKYWMRKSISIDGRGGHSHARIKIYNNHLWGLCIAWESRGDTNLEHTAELTMSERKKLIHWNGSSATDCGSEGTDALLDQRDTGHTRNGTLIWNWTRYSKKHRTEWIPNTIANAARTSTGTYHWSFQSDSPMCQSQGKSGVFANNGMDINPARFSTMRLRCWSRACEKQPFGEAMMTPPKNGP